MAIGYTDDDYFFYTRVCIIAHTELVDSKLGDTLAVFRHYRKRCITDIRNKNPEVAIMGISIERYRPVSGNPSYDAYALRVTMI
jgi:hypothetical protein